MSAVSAQSWSSLIFWARASICSRSRSSLSADMLAPVRFPSMMARAALLGMEKLMLLAATGLSPGLRRARPSISMVRMLALTSTEATSSGTRSRPCSLENAAMISSRESMVVSIYAQPG